MVKNLRTLLIAGLVGLVVGAGIALGVDRLPSGSLGAELAIVRRNLGSAQLALDAARASSDRLKGELGRAQGLAQDGAGSIEAALASAGRLSDATDRVVVLARAIRDLVASLRAIASLSAGAGSTP